MKAIVIDEPGDASMLRLADAPDPVAGDDEVLVRVHASAVNRADVLQRQGSYPPPPGTSEILGLELAGEVAAVGGGVTRFRPSDRVYALSGGGGYAELATIHESLAMPIPDAFDYQQAAALPEVFFTANIAIRTLGRLQQGERALIHAGGSGVGTAAIQIVKLAGGEAWITAGSEEKCAKARDLGADVAINYKMQDFAEEVRKRTDGAGVDVILDVVGAGYWQRNVASLATGGRMVLIALMGGATTEVDLSALMRRRLQIFGSVLRARPLSERAALTRDYREHLEPALVDGRMSPVIDRVFPLREAAEAHRYMEANRNFGKIVLDVGGGG